jgi:ATP-dependent Clp protease protease subunit
MSEQSKKGKSHDIDKEALRLEYLFDKGLNFNDRVIQITGDIDQGYFDFIDAALSELERVSKKSITIKIHSGGGSVYEALAMVGRIKASKCNIITECYGHAMSAASLILAAGSKRRMSRYSYFMTHEASYGLSGSHSHIKEEVAQMEREEQMWSTWMAELSDRSSQFWYRQCEKKNLYLSAEECLEFGIIDEIF